MAGRVGAAKSEQVAGAIEAEIRTGRMAHGDQLASEGTLMQRFAVSRNTVRRGLEMLASKGLITTRTGIGSFVTYDGTTIDSAQGWTVALAHGAGRVETRMLGLHRGPCARADAHLGSPGDYLCLDRLRYSLDAACGISLERSRLPWRDAFAPLLDAGLTQGSLSLTLDGLGLAATGGSETASVLPALSPVDAAIMGRPPHQPMLRLERVTRDADGAVLEYVDSILDPLHFGLRIEF
jgi:GntR family transcriptional regulator